MQIHIVAVGERMPEWVQAGYAEYARRLPHECRLKLHEIPAGKRAKGADVARLTRDEGARQLAAVPDRARVVALDRCGRELDTEQLAERLAKQLAPIDGTRARRTLRPAEAGPQAGGATKSATSVSGKSPPLHSSGSPRARASA